MHEAQQLNQGAGFGPPPIGHHLTDGPLPFGKIAYGQPDYREFVCSKTTADWLMAGAMSRLDGHEVTLQVKETFPGGHNVAVGFWFTDDPYRKAA